MNTNLNMQTVLSSHLDTYQAHHTLSPHQAQVCHHMQDCQTDALGGLQWCCDQCAYQRAAYHSCRDRHCPQCQWRATQAWRDKQ